MVGQVQGNVALVTGAASGIGRQVALLLARVEALEATVAELTKGK